MFTSEIERKKFKLFHILKDAQNLIKVEFALFSLWWEEDDDKYTIMKDNIKDIWDHNIEVLMLTFGTKEETIKTTLKVQDVEESIKANIKRSCEQRKKSKLQLSHSEDYI